MKRCICIPLSVLLSVVTLLAMVSGSGLCQKITVEPGKPKSAPAAKSRVFVFGSTIEDVLRMFGPSPNHIYSRETAMNRYQVEVRWKADDTVSRLHPTQRLFALKIELDKPSTVPAVLRDVPEALAVCKSGCEQYGIVGTLDKPDTILAFPSNPSPAQLEMGALLATNFKFNETESKKTWAVAVRLSLDTNIVARIVERKPPDWTAKVLSLQIETASLYYHVDAKTVELGTWAP